MAKEVKEIRGFIAGTIFNASEEDISGESNSFSLNVNPIAQDGILEGINADKEIFSFNSSSSNLVLPIGYGASSLELYNFPGNDANKVQFIGTKGVLEELDVLYWEPYLESIVTTDSNTGNLLKLHWPDLSAAKWTDIGPDDKFIPLSYHDTSSDKTTDDAHTYFTAGDIIHPSASFSTSKDIMKIESVNQEGVRYIEYGAGQYHMVVTTQFPENSQWTNLSPSNLGGTGSGLRVNISTGTYTAGASSLEDTIITVSSPGIGFTLAEEKMENAVVRLDEIGAFVAQGSNTIALDSGDLKFTWVNNAVAFKFLLKDLGLNHLTSNLTVGTKYRLTARVKTDGSDNFIMHVRNNAGTSLGQSSVIMTSGQWNVYSVDFIATHATTDYWQMEGLDSGEMGWISEVHLFEHRHVVRFEEPGGNGAIEWAPIPWMLFDAASAANTAANLEKYKPIYDYLTVTRRLFKSPKIVLSANTQYTFIKNKIDYGTTVSTLIDTTEPTDRGTLHLSGWSNNDGNHLGGHGRLLKKSAEVKSVKMDTGDYTIEFSADDNSMAVTKDGELFAGIESRYYIGDIITIYAASGVTSANLETSFEIIKTDQIGAKEYLYFKQSVTTETHTSGVFYIEDNIIKNFTFYHQQGLISSEVAQNWSKLQGSLTSLQSNYSKVIPSSNTNVTIVSPGGYYDSTDNSYLGNTDTSANHYPWESAAPYVKIVSDYSDTTLNLQTAMTSTDDVFFTDSTALTDAKLRLGESLLIDAEYMEITDIEQNRVEVLRGVLGSTQAVHSAGAAIKCNRHDGIRQVIDKGRFKPGQKYRLSLKAKQVGTGYAFASITIANYSAFTAGDSIKLTDTNGVEYTYVEGTQNISGGSFDAATSNNQTATNLSLLINSNAHFTAFSGSAVVYITQNQPGVTGNTTTVLTEDSGDPWNITQDFTATPAIEYPIIKTQLKYGGGYITQAGFIQEGDSPNHEPSKYVHFTSFKQKESSLFTSNNFRSADVVWRTYTFDFIVPNIDLGEDLTLDIMNVGKDNSELALDLIHMHEVPFVSILGVESHDFLEAGYIRREGIKDILLYDANEGSLKIIQDFGGQNSLLENFTGDLNFSASKIAFSNTNKEVHIGCGPLPEDDIPKWVGYITRQSLGHNYENKLVVDRDCVPSIEESDDFFQFGSIGANLNSTCLAGEYEKIAATMSSTDWTTDADTVMTVNMGVVHNLSSGDNIIVREYMDLEMNWEGKGQWVITDAAPSGDTTRFVARRYLAGGFPYPPENGFLSANGTRGTNTGVINFRPAYMYGIRAGCYANTTTDTDLFRVYIVDNFNASATALDSIRKKGYIEKNNNLGFQLQHISKAWNDKADGTGGGCIWAVTNKEQSVQGTYKDQYIMKFNIEQSVGFWAASNPTLIVRYRPRLVNFLWDNIQNSYPLTEETNYGNAPTNAVGLELDLDLLTGSSVEDMAHVAEVLETKAPTAAYSYLETDNTHADVAPNTFDTRLWLRMNRSGTGAAATRFLFCGNPSADQVGELVLKFADRSPFSGNQYYQTTPMGYVKTAEVLRDTVPLATQGALETGPGKAFYGTYDLNYTFSSMEWTDSSNNDDYAWSDIAGAQSGNVLNPYHFGYEDDTSSYFSGAYHLLSEYYIDGFEFDSSLRARHGVHAGYMLSEFKIHVTPAEESGNPTEGSYCFGHGVGHGLSGDNPNSSEEMNFEKMYADTPYPKKRFGYVNFGENTSVNGGIHPRKMIQITDNDGDYLLDGTNLTMLTKETASHTDSTGTCNPFGRQGFRVCSHAVGLITNVSSYKKNAGRMHSNSLNNWATDFFTDNSGNYHNLPDRQGRAGLDHYTDTMWSDCFTDKSSNFLLNFDPSASGNVANTDIELMATDIYNNNINFVNSPKEGFRGVVPESTNDGMYLITCPDIHHGDLVQTNQYLDCTMATYNFSVNANNHRKITSTIKHNLQAMDLVYVRHTTTAGTNFLNTAHTGASVYELTGTSFYVTAVIDDYSFIISMGTDEGFTASSNTHNVRVYFGGYKPISYKSSDEEGASARLRDCGTSLTSVNHLSSTGDAGKGEGPIGGPGKTVYHYSYSNDDSSDPTIYGNLNYNKAWYTENTNIGPPRLLNYFYTIRKELRTSDFKNQTDTNFDGSFTNVGQDATTSYWDPTDWLPFQYDDNDLSNWYLPKPTDIIRCSGAMQNRRAWDYLFPQIAFRVDRLNMLAGCTMKRLPEGSPDGMYDSPFYDAPAFPDPIYHKGEANNGAKFHHVGTGNDLGKNADASYVDLYYGKKLYLNKMNSTKNSSLANRKEARLSMGEVAYDLMAGGGDSTFTNYIAALISTNAVNPDEPGTQANYGYYAGYLTGEEGLWETADFDYYDEQYFYNNDGDIVPAPPDASYDGAGWHYEEYGLGTNRNIYQPTIQELLGNTSVGLNKKNNFPSKNSNILGRVSSYITTNNAATPDAALHPVVRVSVSPSSLWLCNVKEMGPEEIPGFSMYDQDEGANQAFSGGLDVDKSRIYPVYNRTFSTEWGDNDNDGDAGEVVIETSGKCDWIEHGTAGNKWTADSGICAGKIDFADYTGSGSFDNTEGLINGISQTLLSGAFGSDTAGDPLGSGMDNGTAGFLHLKDTTSSGTENKYVRLHENYWALRNLNSPTQKLVAGRNYRLTYSIQIKTLGHVNQDIKVGIYQGDTAQHVTEYLGDAGGTDITNYHPTAIRGTVDFVYHADDEYICVELVKATAAAGTELAFGQVSLRENERSQLHGGPWYKHGKARYVMPKVFPDGAGVNPRIGADLIPPRTDVGFSGSYEHNDTVFREEEGQMLGFHHYSHQHYDNRDRESMSPGTLHQNTQSNQELVYTQIDTGVTDLRNINAPVRSFYRVRNVWAGMYMVVKQQYGAALFGNRQVRKIIGSYSLGNDADSEMAFVVNRPFTKEPTAGDIIEIIRHSDACHDILPVGTYNMPGFRTPYSTYSHTSDSSEAMNLQIKSSDYREPIFSQVLDEVLQEWHGRAAIAYNAGSGLATMTFKDIDGNTTYHRLYTGQKIKTSIAQPNTHVITVTGPNTFTFISSHHNYDAVTDGDIIDITLDSSGSAFHGHGAEFYPDKGPTLSMYGGAGYQGLREYTVVDIDHTKEADGSGTAGYARLELDATGAYHHLKVGDIFTLRKASTNADHEGQYHVVALSGTVGATTRYIGIVSNVTVNTSNNYTIYCPSYCLVGTPATSHYGIDKVGFGPIDYDRGKWIGNAMYPVEASEFIDDFCLNTVIVDESIEDTEFASIINPWDQEEGAFFKKNTSYNYSIALIYDGYQEGPLMSSPIGTHFNATNDFNRIEINLSVLTNVSPRLTHIALYRQDDPSDPYKLVEQVAINNANWMYNESGIWSYIVEDTGDVGATFEARAGISEHLDSVTIKYGISKECKGYLFIADCYHPEVPNAENLVFRSLPGKFSIFNWPYHFLQLQSKPTALANFGNKLYAFDNHNTYTINPDLLIIEKTFRGVGCSSTKSVQVTEFGMFYADRNGAYWHDGTNPRKISKPIQTGGDSNMLSYSNSSTTGSGLVPDYSWEKTVGDKTHIAPIVLYSPEMQSVLFLIEAKHRDKRTLGNLSEEFNETKFYAWSFQLEKMRWDLWELSDNEKPSTAFLGDGGELCITLGSTIYHYHGADYKKPFTWLSKKLNMDSVSQMKVFRRVLLSGVANRLNKAESNDDKFGGDRLIVATSSGRLANSDMTFSKDTAGNSKYLLSGQNKKGNWIQVKLEDMTDSIDAVSVIFRRKAVK